MDFSSRKRSENKETGRRLRGEALIRPVGVGALRNGAEAPGRSLDPPRGCGGKFNYLHIHGTW